MPPAFVVPPHGHAPPHVLVMLDGSLTEEADDARRQCDAGSIRYSPGGDRHVGQVGPTGAHCLVLEAPGFPELRLRRRCYLDAAQVAAQVDSLTHALLVAPCVSPANVEEHALAVFARVRAKFRASQVRHHEWLAAAVRCLDDVQVSRAPLADAARAVRRNPSLLSRVFRATYGVSLHRYYRRRQIDRAWTLLAAGLPLSTVAANSGFTDQAHMTRVFATEIGQTPARIRKRMQSTDSDRYHWYRAVPLRAIPSPSHSFVER